MPEGDPINLTAAVIVAVFGCLMGIVVTVRLVRDVRRRNRLLAELPDREEFDADIRRYLRRCWLLYAEWRERVEDPTRLHEHWQALWSRAESLQQERSEHAETTDSVAELVELERKLEQLIDELR